MGVAGYQPKMSDACERADQLIRNVADVKLERQQRDPLYDTRCGGVSDGTAATKLGAGYDVLAPGKRSCPYHFHHAQEEMFVILEGDGTLRVAGEMLPVRAGDVVFIPPGPEYPHQFINTSDAPMTLPQHQHAGAAGDLRVPGLGQGVRLRARAAHAPAPGAIRSDYWDGEP